MQNLLWWEWLYARARGKKKRIKRARNPFADNEIKTCVCHFEHVPFFWAWALYVIKQTRVLSLHILCLPDTFVLTSEALTFLEPRIGRGMQIRPAVSRRFHPFWSKWMYFITLGFHRLIMTHPFVCWLHLWFTMHLCVNEAIFTMPLNIGNTDTAQGRGGRLWRRYKRESRWNSAIFF